MTTQSSELETFINSVKASLVDTPYMLEEKPGGFDVLINLADTKWWGLISRNGIRDVFTYEVRVNEAAKTYALNDVARRLDWSAGVNPADLKPHFDMNYKYQSGSINGYRREITIGGTDQGEIKPVVDINFSPTVRKDAIKSIAAQLGWKKSLSKDQKIGAWVAGFAGVLVVVILIAALLFNTILK